MSKAQIFCHTVMVVIPPVRIARIITFGQNYFFYHQIKPSFRIQGVRIGYIAIAHFRDILDDGRFCIELENTFTNANIRQPFEV